MIESRISDAQSYLGLGDNSNDSSISPIEDQVNVSRCRKSSISTVIARMQEDRVKKLSRGQTVSLFLRITVTSEEGSEAGTRMFGLSKNRAEGSREGTGTGEISLSGGSTPLLSRSPRFCHRYVNPNCVLQIDREILSKCLCSISPHQSCSKL